MDRDELPCSDKLAFDSRSAAQAAATVALYQRGIKLKTYLCRYCRLWHMSSNPND